MAIIGLHALMYSKQDEATRTFFRDIAGEDTEDHELYLMCDDNETTRAELTRKGVTTRPVQDRSWGRVTQIMLPSGEELGMYEPRHPTAIAGRGSL